MSHMSPNYSHHLQVLTLISSKQGRKMVTMVGKKEREMARVIGKVACEELPLTPKAGPGLSHFFSWRLSVGERELQRQ